MTALLRRISIRQRLLGSMLLLAVLIVALGGWSAWSLQQQQRRAETQMKAQAEVAEAGHALMLALEQVQRLEQSVLLNGNNAVEAAELKTAWGKSADTLRAQLASRQEAPLKEAVAALQRYQQQVADTLQQVVDAKMDSSAGFAYTSQADAELQAIRDAARGWVAEQDAAMKAAQADEAQATQRGSMLRIGALLLMLGGFVTLRWTIARSIIQPLDEATRAAEAIAGGDLAQRLQVEGQDELSHFMGTLVRMQVSLRDVVSQVRDSADSIRVASAEVASGNLDLSQRTERAASDLQSTASNVQELARIAQTGSDSAHQASQLANSASDVARRGGEAMDRVVSTMDEIAQASRDRKSTRLNSSHSQQSRMPSSA